MDLSLNAHESIHKRRLTDYSSTRRLIDASRRLYQGPARMPFDEELYREHRVKRGLRNEDGSGVVAGLTSISNVHGYRYENGALVPEEGELLIRGYNIRDLISRAQQEDRFGYSELAFLLLAGELPTREELLFTDARIAELRTLNSQYISEFPIAAKSNSIMNALQRAVLLLYAFDEDPDTITPEHEVDVALSLMARLPRIAAIAHTVRCAELAGTTPRIPAPNDAYSTAESLLQVLRGGDDFTHEEAMLLDVMLMLHAEHGGGNNSTFATRVLSSSATDPYSAYAAAIGSLKGPRHGGANAKVMAMHEDIRANVVFWEDDHEVARYLARILRGEAFDGTGLIYGMGHAVYTLSDPRAQICRAYARDLAHAKGLGAEFELIERIERLAPQVVERVCRTTKPICANIDLYTGFIYQMLGVPETLYTPLFAVARMAGWAAHRMEELFCANRIIRPAYASVMRANTYVPLSQRHAKEQP